MSTFIPAQRRPRGSFTRSALWAEMLKARRSKAPWLVGAGFLIVPLVDGLLMVILKDPEAARSMGLISTKAQLTAGTADWPTFLNVLSQAMAVGGYLLFSILTSWVFGREFSDQTVKNLLSIPTPRSVIVAAKFATVVLWSAAVTVIIWGIAIGIGVAVELPGWSTDVLISGTLTLLATTGMVIALMAPVALVASAGQGYLAPIGWTFLTVALAQIMVVTGWGGWFPWSVPALFIGFAGPPGDQVNLWSYLLVGSVMLAGLAGTFAWWQYADQPR